jgi:hypothetical protein
MISLTSTHFPEPLPRRGMHSHIYAVSFSYPPFAPLRPLVLLPMPLTPPACSRRPPSKTYLNGIILLVVANNVDSLLDLSKNEVTVRVVSLLFH